MTLLQQVQAEQACRTQTRKNKNQVLKSSARSSPHWWELVEGHLPRRSTVRQSQRERLENRHSS